MIVHKSIYECILNPEIIDLTYRFFTKFPHSPYSIYILPTTTLLAMEKKILAHEKLNFKYLELKFRYLVLNIR
jgi:hypothetical protein